MFLKSFRLNLEKLVVLVALVSFQGLLAQQNLVSTTPVSEGFTLSDSKTTANLIVDAADYEGVHIAAKNLQLDLERVTGKKPEVFNKLSGKPQLIIGTLGKSSFIDSLAQTGKLNVSAIKNQWEAFSIQQVDGNLVIAGSDKRGTIYGIYTLSEAIGVSPCYWWADVPVKKSEQLYVNAANYTNPGPKVHYRGIFINDEAPALSGWVGENYGSFNHEFYEHVFELILRLKGNYLWPAMWGRAFYDDDPENAVQAEKYGVVIGTSHHEPLMRAHVEWDRYGKGDWNYATNPEVLRDFWKAGIERMGDNESIVTVGMRGDGDEPMTEGTAIELLEGIVKDQRQIIEDVTGKPASETPQLWALYKEVQDYYDQGMRVPDDVTLLLADDNWGNIRKLPNPEDAGRTGGYGIYYHFDYVGGPRNYKWLNTNQISRVYEQMSLAYEYNARKIWIVNVGDIKPMEYPISFFLDYAWNPESFDLADLKEYPEQWAAAQFGDTYASEIAGLIQNYSTLASRRKPELLSPKTFSLHHFNEAQRILQEYDELEQEAKRIKEELDDSYQSAYYQLVLFPIEAMANLNRLYIAAAKNHLYAEQGRNTTNAYAEQVAEFFEKDKELTRAYHSLNDSKWNHFMDQTHIGYTYWQEPRQNVIPETKQIEIPQEGHLGISIAGTEAYFPKDQVLNVLPFDQSHQHQQLTLFNTGKEEVDYKIKKLPKWLKVDQKKGAVKTEEQLTLSLIPGKLPASDQEGVISIQSDHGMATLQVSYNPYPAGTEGTVSYAGLISIPATAFTANTGWEQIPDLGRQDNALRPETKFSKGITPENTALTYELYANEAIDGTITFNLSPTLDFKNQGGLKFQYQIDDEPVQTLNMHKDTPDNWNSSVANNTTRVVAPVRLQKGAHQLKIYGVDPAIVLQHIIIRAETNNQSFYLAPVTIAGLKD
ncbi:glycosyl hydrolase 115 family protein [Leeuwenhoekiella sp. H156]|uniref:glycosyl hydrolase 115 family protein n=1 Tax=Leeuwenhoekiella sp. H156 TaxID=3450128 RepID=UPI003FA4288D